MFIKNIIDIIINDPYHITYIGVGSAFVRESKPEDMQQFPPFIENLLHLTNYKLRLINIDSSFEKELFLLSYLKDLEKISDIQYKNNRLSVIYINETLNITDTHSDHIDTLNTINKVIMEQNNLLITGIYIGYNIKYLEKYFYLLYQNTKYEDLYNNLIIYDFTDDGIGNCTCNLLENYPIIDYQKKCIIKIDNNINKLYDQYIKYIDDYEIINKLKNIFCKQIISYLTNNHYIYRNILSNNIDTYLESLIKNSIFNNYKNINDIKNIFINDLKKIIIFIELVLVIDKENYYDLCYLINNFESFDLYNWLIFTKNLIQKIINFNKF